MSVSTSHSKRIQNFDQLDFYLGKTGGVKLIDSRYLEVEDEETVARIKTYAKDTLRSIWGRRYNPKRVIDRLLNLIGYTDALIAKYGIIMVAARRKLDKENPDSILSLIEQKLSLQVNMIISKLHLSRKVYWPWMSIFSYPSIRSGECHPWISRFKKTLGYSTVDDAKKIRINMELYRSTTLRWIEKYIEKDKLVELKRIIEKLQRIHFLSERDELEEETDLILTNMVVDHFCPHWNKHKNLSTISRCSTVKKYLEPTIYEKLRLALYILLDDYMGLGRELKRIINKNFDIEKDSN